MESKLRYYVRYSTREKFEADFEANLKFGGCQILEPNAPEIFTLVEVVLSLAGSAEVALTGRVVQKIAGHSFMVQFNQDSLAVQDALLPLREESTRDDSAETVDEEHPTEFLDSLVKMPPVESDDSPGTVHDQVRAMSVAEKKRLALSGSRSERIVLARDPQKVVHVFLLKNPRLTLDEVVFMARNSQTNPEALQLIADNTRWISDSRVVSALALNPKTPLQTALKALDKLSTTELRRIAKRQDLKQAILRAARRKVLKPT